MARGTSSGGVSNGYIARIAAALKNTDPDLDTLAKEVIETTGGGEEEALNAVNRTYLNLDMDNDAQMDNALSLGQLISNVFKGRGAS